MKKLTSKLSLSRPKKKPIYEQNISIGSDEPITPVKNPHKKSKSVKVTPKSKKLLNSGPKKKTPG